MNATPKPAAAPDELDRLFTDYFKSQLKRPWPNAPIPVAAATPAEPSELAVARASETPRNRPNPATRDNTARARFTLAASVALMLGTCWYLSNGFEPGTRQGAPASNPALPNMLNGSDADGNKHLPLKTIEQDKVKEHGPKIDMEKFE
ncbi:hypothetical protein [Frigoriglobus tundricola]|uniref:Uncharacterized protein n=1 Tax=Frigoriglobus tundricola TaxID=2774151 RepID=A0A6M5Z1R9_9BACT|nr:hypothetical protein [Frigoriglobus tundricola]QJW99371.1 hypothetical protein FTUN_6979 [Frigoriglobus tundricola]